MSEWEIKFSRHATKDLKKLGKIGLADKCIGLIDPISSDPLYFPPHWEKLTDRENTYSRRITHYHRLVYAVYEVEKAVLILSCFGHYGD